jgi:hypothetical protein
MPQNPSLFRGIASGGTAERAAGTLSAAPPWDDELRFLSQPRSNRDQVRTFPELVTAAAAVKAEGRGIRFLM